MRPKIDWKHSLSIRENVHILYIRCDNVIFHLYLSNEKSVKHIYVLFTDIKVRYQSIVMDVPST